MRNQPFSKLLRLALIPAVVGITVSANAQVGNTTHQKQSGNKAAETQMSGTQSARSDQANYSAVRASKMIGMKVRNNQEKSLGEIKDLIVNMNTGDVRYAVLEFDPGIFQGERLFAVPTNQFQMAGSRDGLVYNMTRERLENARVDRASWDKREPLNTDNLDRNWGVAKATDGARAHRASDLIGKDVNSRNGQDIGDVKDLVINLANQKVHYAVLAFDPGWTSPEELYAFPLSAFSPTADNDKVVLDIDKARLQRMKSFTNSDFARLNDPNWTADMDRYFVTVLPVLMVTRRDSASAGNTTTGKNASGSTQLFTRLDTDKDGSLARTEVRGNDTVNKQWSRLDKDGNGTVTRAEFTGNYSTTVQ